jgi:opacity protein-like surface antigen
MLKSYSIIPTGIAMAAVLAFLGRSVSADEIYFDTISTKRAAREMGAYFGAFGGGAQLNGASFQGRMDGLESHDENGWLIGAEFGFSYKTPLPLRLFTELEASYLSTAFDADGPISVLRSDLRGINLLLNGGLQLDMSDQRDQVGPFWAGFKPYVGAGIGGAYVRQSNIYFEKNGRMVREGGKATDWTWAYEVFAGIEYAFSDTFSVYGEYKRLSYADLSGGDVSDVDFDLWAVGIKIQY